MNMRTILLVVVIVSALAGIAWFSGHDAHRATGSVAVDRDSPAPPSPAAPTSEPRVASPAPIAVAGSAAPDGAVAAGGIAVGASVRPGVGDFMCIGSALCEQRALIDPRVAATPAEAYWMAARGFPTQSELEFASSASAVEITQRAAATRSEALHVLGLEKEIAGASDPDRLSEVMIELSDRADRRRQSYAYYGLAAAKVRLWEISGSGDASRWAHIVGAATALKKAVLLGDVKATSLYATLPAGFVDAGVWAAADRDALLQLQRSSSDGRFVGLGDASPRPVAAVSPATPPRG
jgi:hypothetical protein